MSNLIHIGHGLTLSFTKDGDSRDVWLYFKASNGKQAGLSIAAIAERNGGVIGDALKGWGSDRLDEHMAELIAEEETREEKAAHGQFGAGA